MKITIKLLNGKEFPLSGREAILNVDKQKDLDMILEYQQFGFLNDNDKEKYGPGLEKILDKNGDYILRNVRTGEIILNGCKRIVPIFKSGISTTTSSQSICNGMMYYQTAYPEENWLLCYTVTYDNNKDVEPKYEFQKVKHCLLDKVIGNLFSIDGYIIKNVNESEVAMTNEIKKYIKNNNSFQMSSILSEFQALNIIDKSNISLVIEIIDEMVMNGELEIKADNQENIYYEVKSLSKPPYTKSLNRK